MTTRFDTKDPAEVITAEFDFDPMGEPTGTPTISIDVREGEDADANDMLLGSPVIVGSKVLQRIRAGLDARDYSLRCLADVEGNTLLIDAILPVRARPSS